MAEQSQLNIYQKLAKIREQVEVMRKNKSGYGYTYVSDGNPNHFSVTRHKLAKSRKTMPCKGFSEISD